MASSEVANHVVGQVHKGPWSIAKWAEILDMHGLHPQHT